MGRTFLTLLNRSRKDPSFVKMLIGLSFPFFDAKAEAEPDDAGVVTNEKERRMCESAGRLCSLRAQASWLVSICARQDLRLAL